MGRRILTDAGYEVVTVNNGSAALKKIQEQKPDLIVLDVYMPGYGGLEVCQRIKEARETTRIPVLLTVGKLEPFKPDEAKRVRADAYIIKPFEASELLTALTKLEDKIVPQAQTPKSGRFAKALAAIESSDDRFGDSETGWKERLIIPTPSGRLEEPVGLTTEPLAAVTAPVSQIEEEQDFRPAESKPSETSVPAGLPADITAEEVAALNAAATALAGRIPGATAEPSTVTEAAGPRPEATGESSAAEENVPEATAASDASALGALTTKISEKPAAINPGRDSTESVLTDQSSREFSPTEAVAVSSGQDQNESRPVNGDANWNKDAELLAALASLAPVEAQAADLATNVPSIVNQVVELAQAPVPTASSKAGPHWIAEAIALTAEDSSLVLEQEMEKVVAAVALVEARKSSEPARAESQASEASAAAVSEAEPISFAVSSQAAAGEPPAPPAEAAYAAAAGSASPIERPRAEPLVSSASASPGITPADPGQVESQDAELAAAWQNWKQIRETAVASQAGVEPERTATPELKTEPAAPLEPELRKTDPDEVTGEDSEAESAAGEEAEEPAAIASIVDSMLAELRPKLVEEITRKMNSAKKAKVKKNKS